MISVSDNFFLVSSVICVGKIISRLFLQPVFLHRTLTYMRSRQAPRNNMARLRGFKIDSLLERKLKETSDNLELMKPYMTLTFLGFYEKKRETFDAFSRFL